MFFCTLAINKIKSKNKKLVAIQEIDEPQKKKKKSVSLLCHWANAHFHWCESNGHVNRLVHVSNNLSRHRHVNTDKGMNKHTNTCYKIQTHAHFLHSLNLVQIHMYMIKSHICVLSFAPNSPLSQHYP